jgi:hypothetical protein
VAAPAHAQHRPQGRHRDGTRRLAQDPDEEADLRNLPHGQSRSTSGACAIFKVHQGIEDCIALALFTARLHTRHERGHFTLKIALRGINAAHGRSGQGEPGP